MGFWSSFAKYALPAVGIAAAPFTGGGSLLTTLGLGAKTAGLIGAGATAAGRIASGASRQRAEDRGAQADYDVTRVPIQNQQALQFAQAKRQAEADRMRQIGGADMLANFSAPSDPRAQKFLNNGQLRGGQMNPETIAMMRERALKALESGSDVPQMQTMPDRPGGGGTKTDSFLNALSMGSTALGALNESGVFGRSQPAPTGERIGSISDIARLLPAAPDEDAPAWSPLSALNMRAMRDRGNA